MAGTSQFAVRRSLPGRGRGLFATRDIRRGERILEYTGRRISAALADTLSTRYLFEIDKNWTVDGSSHDNVARYVNHSCNPNCEAEIVNGRIFIHALWDIERGEELTMDYGDEYFDEFIKPAGCKCAKCASV